MVILVSDTSVLIDLERGGILEAAFSCNLAMVVPDYLYDQELAAHNGSLLRALGLGVVPLTPDEVAFAQEVRRRRSGLSWSDCFALSCARRAGYALVTSDKTMRSEAMKQLGSVYRLLWILDQMEGSGSVCTALLYEGLSRIANHPNCRQPKADMAQRLARWSGG